MKRIATLAALAAAALTTPAARAGTARLYVTDSTGDSVAAIDPATNRVVQAIHGIPKPHGIAFSPDTRRLYVSSERENALDVIDRPSGRIIGKVALSGRPNNIAVTKDGRRILVAISDGPGALDLVDAARLERVKSIPVAGPLHNVYVTPDGKYAVAGSVPAKRLTVIDLAAGKPVWALRFDTGVRPMAIEANPDGSTRRLFVELSHFAGFAVVDFAARKEVARISLPPEPSGFPIPPARAAAPSHGIAVAPDGRTLWVDSDAANAVFVYALPALRLIGHVALPGSPTMPALPNWLSFAPDGKRLYVSDSGIGEISVIDTAAVKTIAAIPVGGMPKRSGAVALR